MFVVIVVVDMVVVMNMLVRSSFYSLADVTSYNTDNFAPFCFFEDFMRFYFPLSVFFEELEFAGFCFLKLHGKDNKA